MAELTHCPTCQGPVSNEAEACPHCGQPLVGKRDLPPSMQASAKIPLPPRAPSPKRGALWGCSMLLLLIGIIMGSIYALMFSIAPDTTQRRDTRPSHPNNNRTNRIHKKDAPSPDDKIPLTSPENR
ncbi:MAG: hypothetical protein QF752_08455 [Planctomycetota bacterium]|nr:hypothetical protein [Planctomycetota bacterium]